jgi:hypothetical protein
MNFYYTSYYWTVRIHKRTGKVLNESWSKNCEYETEQEALLDFEQDRKNHPELKWKLVKEAWEVLYEDKVWAAE